MKISEEQVRYVAELAHLTLDESEVQAYQKDLEDILEYVDKLNELDVAAVEPMAQVLWEGATEQTLRADETEESFAAEQALANAPLAGAGHFKVPRVIER